MQNRKENLTKKVHIGVYGICKSNDSILMVLKSRGPYKGKYDLPGGKIETSESLEDALRREFKEEIGCTIKSLSFLTSAEDEFTYQNSSGGEVTFRHTGSYYSVELHGDSDTRKGPDGHDSLGATWIKIQDILDNRVSVPNIVRSVLSDFVSKKT